MSNMWTWAMANPFCFAIIAFPVVTTACVGSYKLLKSILTNRW